MYVKGLYCMRNDLRAVILGVGNVPLDSFIYQTLIVLLLDSQDTNEEVARNIILLHKEEEEELGIVVGKSQALPPFSCVCVNCKQ